MRLSCPDRTVSVCHQVLDLGLCGRGMTDRLLQKAFADPAKSSGLKQLRIGGAYRLTDAGVAAAAKAAPAIEAVEVTHSERVTAEAAKAVAEACGHKCVRRWLRTSPRLSTASPFPLCLQMRDQGS